MKTIVQLKSILAFTLIALSLTNCVRNDDFDIPPIQCNDQWVATHNISEVKNMVNQENPATPVPLPADVVFEGYVISTDETGNFFKTLAIQDSRTNPTAGLQLELDKTNTYTNFPVGSKILVRANGLYIAKHRGPIKVGRLGSDNFPIERLADNLVFAHVNLACDPIQPIEPKVYTSIAEARQESNLNTLIRLEGVQFRNAGNGETFFDAANAFGGASNVIVEDQSGATIQLRNSQYATFAAEILPDGSGSLTAVLSAYTSPNNNVTPSTYQLFIRGTEDVDFDQERFYTGPPPSQQYWSCLNENFESYVLNNNNFPRYHNIAASGDRKWEVRTFDNNKYIQLTAHNSNTQVTTYFVVPVNFSNADSFSFRTKAGFDNGAPLTVHYTTNWNIQNPVVNEANLVDITSSFSISTGPSNGYAANYTPSGNYSLSSLSGNGAIVFKYSGIATGGGVTTTMQIDDIVITDNENPNCN
ncbi:MAG: DUF5689 domain-containing protein [Weeksellaceae bacterium]|nr:DUF5689 domain-containing protein [Weeksellaceae bacterium]